MNRMLFNKSGRRLNPQEIRQRVLETYNMEIIEGLDEVIDCNGCIENVNYSASFTNDGNNHSWYMKQQENKYIRWKTQKIRKQGKYAVFLFVMGMGNMSPLPQPTGCFDLYLNGNHLLSFRVIKYREVWRGKHNSLFCFDPKRVEFAKPGFGLTLDDVIREASLAIFGLGFLKVPIQLLGDKDCVEIEVKASCFVKSQQFFKLDMVKNIIGWTDITDGLELLSKEKKDFSIGNYNVYFGDIHAHSGEYEKIGGCGTGYIEENYRYARDVSNLDICCITDHDWQLGETLWKKHKQLCDKYYQPDSFVTLLGFEWTNSLYGHRNVYYCKEKYTGSNAPLVISNSTENYWNENNEHNPNKLWEKLDNAHVEAITIPHHPSATHHPLTWEYYNEKYDRLVEIYSTWGSSEYPENTIHGNGSDRYKDLYVRSALNKGYKYGFIASSDGHDGHPGNSQSPHIKHRHVYHYQGSGWIAVLANKLTRENIFESMKKRLCYATTGVPILLNVMIDNHPMGSIIKKAHPVNIEVKGRGCGIIDSIDIIKNGKVVYRHTEYESTYEIDFTWVDRSPVLVSIDYYYARVIQKDGEMAWSSPIWVERRARTS